jgi:hypothetical protein
VILLSGASDWHCHAKMNDGIVHLCLYLTLMRSTNTRCSTRLPYPTQLLPKNIAVMSEDSHPPKRQRLEPKGSSVNGALVSLPPNQHSSSANSNNISRLDGNVHNGNSNGDGKDVAFTSTIAAIVGNDVPTDVLKRLEDVSGGNIERGTLLRLADLFCCWSSAVLQSILIFFLLNWLV